MEDLLAIGIRISILYLYVLAVFRLSGKRSVDTLSPLDFVVANLVSDLFDDVIWAEVPLAQGLVAFTTIVVLHMFLSFLESRNHSIFCLVSGMKTVVIQHGSFREAGLREERTRQSEVLSQMRLLQVEKIEEVREGAWEPGGKLSVMKQEPAKTATQSQYPKLKAVLRR